MDESGFEHETIRPYGYAPIGKPCIDRYNWQGKKRTNVIGALYERVLFALDYFEKNINGDVFYNWCKYTLVPSLKTKCVIVMDNASFNKRELLARHNRPSMALYIQAKFLRQGWMENNLPKLFHDMGCIDFILN